MHPRADVDADFDVPGIGIALARKRLDVALALGVDIVDDPRFLGLAVRSFPAPLTYRNLLLPPRMK